MSIWYIGQLPKPHWLCSNNPKCWDKLNVQRYQDDCMNLLLRGVQQECQLQDRSRMCEAGRSWRAKIEKDKWARNIYSLTHNALITTQEQAWISEILFASVLCDTWKGRTHFLAHSWALVSFVSIRQSLGRSQRYNSALIISIWAFYLCLLWKIHVDLFCTPGLPLQFSRSTMDKSCVCWWC